MSDNVEDPALPLIDPSREDAVSSAAKDDAERTKFLAEAEKLRAEAKYLARPFWERTESLGLMGSILVAAVGLGGVIYTQSIKEQNEKLQRETDALVQSKKDLESAQKLLTPQIDDLINQRASLQNDRAGLETNVAVLSEKTVTQNNELQNQLDRNDQLKTEERTLVAERDKLKNEAQYSQIDSLIAQMKYDYGRSNSSRVDDAVLRLIKDAPPDERARLIARSEERANSADIDANLRSHLYYMLYEATQDPRFKAELLDFAQRYFFAASKDFPKLPISDYQNVIRGFIMPDTLDPADCRLLTHALWNRELDGGRDLARASSAQLEDFLSLNRCGSLQNPEAYMESVALLQDRLIKTSDPQEARYLASVLRVFEPQCLVFTYYFRPDTDRWKPSAKEEVESAERDLRGIATRLYLVPLMFMPTPEMSASVPQLEAWRSSHAQLVNFWVPIKYNEALYDPVMPLLLHRRFLKESDLPDGN